MSACRSLWWQVEVNALRKLFWSLSVAVLAIAAGGVSAAEPSGVLRIMTWNLEVFNQRNTHPSHRDTPYGPRTDGELDELARRVVDTGASIIALQEMNQMSGLHAFRDRLNARPGSSGRWEVFPSTWTFQQNALLYDGARVTAVNPRHVVWTRSGGTYPAEAVFRAPVTAIFSSDLVPGMRFRVIGVHGSYQGAAWRERQGVWLDAFVGELLASAGEPTGIVLVGDMNGAAVAGQVPHDGIIANGRLRHVAKANGDATAIGGSSIDHVYVSAAAEAFLAEPASTVVREDHYGESAEDFRRIASDHYPVSCDLRASPAGTVSKTAEAAALHAGDGPSLAAEPSAPAGGVSSGRSGDAAVGPDGGTGLTPIFSALGAGAMIAVLAGLGAWLRRPASWPRGRSLGGCRGSPPGARHR